VQSRKSGYAWFNYAVLAPVPVVGRVNVNTASERLLTSLPGIDRELARAIYHGYDATGKPTLKPYRCAGDLLAVKGMTLATFESVVNLVMVDSSTYTVSVEAQAVIPGTEDADFSPASVSARQRKRFIVETAQDGGRLAGVHILEQTRL